MSDTPETDARVEEIRRDYGGWGDGSAFALANYARQLARESAALRQQLEAVTKELKRVGEKHSEELQNERRLHTLMEQRAQAAEARAEALQKDAERYRWLVESKGIAHRMGVYGRRIPCPDNLPGCLVEHRGPIEKSEVDAAIDASRSQDSGQAGTPVPS